MGYRMSVGCSCEDAHYFLELDHDFATRVWLDPEGVLKELGISALASMGRPGNDEDEEAEQVLIAPDEFVRWLEALEAQRANIVEGLRRRGGHPSKWSAWQEREFGESARAYRELAEHAADVGAEVDVGWA
jgi:sugar phosphate isomerase/epimerase